LKSPLKSGDDGEKYFMKKIFAANWKLYKNPKETRAFFEVFNKLNLTDKSDVVFFVPATSAVVAQECIGQHSTISWGAQNCYVETQGAFTGEISAQMIQDIGGKWILLGHSERRTIFKEDDSFVARKVQKVQQLGLQPMLCIGETLEERESGKIEQVLKQQLSVGLSLADKSKPMVIAYEPVWAIGTGKVATTQQVKETHALVHEILAKLDFAQTPVLYGGSVKPDNAQELISLPGVDGFLVGGASLDPLSFEKIVQSQK
jgi:triosephosphate isomerase